MNASTQHLIAGLFDRALALGLHSELAELGPAQLVAPETISRGATERVLAHIRALSAASNQFNVAEIVSETLFHEHQRLAHPEDPQRAQLDSAHYAAIGRQLAQATPEQGWQLLRNVIAHYAAEIEGRFDRRAYLAATRVIPVALTLLLHGNSPSQLLRRLPSLPSLDEQLILSGHVASLQRLARLGTVMLTPTHQSHLDSPLVGYAIYRMGLPPFVYGAGLNMFNNPVLGFFLRRLGAYSVDRRKDDPLYREVLKAYATLSLELGQHHLFFPGGTRSRSGAVEAHLKKGLLGAGIAAFGDNLRARKPWPRVFIVPCTCTYPLVLEAETLIEDYLQREAAGRYIPVPDEAESFARWLHLLETLLKLELRVHVRIGQPLDPFGNSVDDAGESHDARGRKLDPADYLKRDGELVDDPERDSEYTRYLAGQLVRAFHRDNTVMPTHAVAFAVLEQLRRQYPAHDCVRFLRGLRGSAYVPRSEVLAAIERLRGELLQRAARGELQLDPGVAQAAPESIVARALQAFASYHRTGVLREQGAGLHVTSENLTFFYRNRLEGYGLLGAAPMLLRSDR